MRKRFLRPVSLISSCVLMAALGATSLTTIGCERELSSKKKVTVDEDGTVETEQERVVENPDGSITKEQSKRKIDPPEAP